MPEARVLAGSDKGSCWLRLEGDIRFELSPAVEQFVQRTFTGRSFRDVTVDLTGATHIDSTMLGLLARFAGRAARAGCARPVVLSTSGDIDLLLDTMGFDAVYEIVHESRQPPTALREQKSGERPDDALSETVLHAHETLAEMNDRNRQTFGPAVRMLRRELGTDPRSR